MAYRRQQVNGPPSPPLSPVPMEDVDTLVIGCGITGINTAYRMREAFPENKIAILEARPIMGGTWTFFKYPGLRCDSSMRGYGFKWHPWTGEKVMIKGDQIADYIEEAACESGLTDLIRYGNRVVGANWDSHKQRWEVEIDVTIYEDNDESRPLGPPNRKRIDAKVILLTSGYYSYKRAMPAEIPGLDNFTGTVAHPQWWPTDLDLTGKRIALIGSGATAVTLFPEFVKTSAHVTLIQRSPSYILNLESVVGFDCWAYRWFSPVWAAWLSWLRVVIVENLFWIFCVYAPHSARYILLGQAKQIMGADFPDEKHFTPRHNPGDQRTCMTPDGEFFHALARPNASIVTGKIADVSKSAVIMEDGTTIEADVIVSATGLYRHMFDGITPTVDGEPIIWKDRFAWRGSMLEGVPNMAFMMGYSSLTWTNGIDIMAQNVIRVLKHAAKIGATNVRPEVGVGRATMFRRPIMVSTATYSVASRDRVPMSGVGSPWYGRICFFYDWIQSKMMNVQDGLVYEVPSKKRV